MILFNMMMFLVLPVRPEDMDHLGGKGNPLPVQRSQPVQKGEAFPWYVLTIVILLKRWQLKYGADINPKGLVPAIEYKGKALYESLILCELLEEEYPNHTPNILPKDPVDRAYARIWIDYISKSILPWYMRLLQSQELEKQKEALEELNKAYRTFADKIQGPYFLGEEFSLVDIAIVPWIVRDYILKEHRAFTREGVSQKWQKYAELVEKRDSVLRTQSVSALLLRYMEIFIDDQSTS
jgi:glutathione S-transferase